MSDMEEREESFDAEAVIEIVENQINDNNPPRVKETLMRLMLQGIDREEAMQFIACALCVELVGVINDQETFNEERYNKNLDLLPEMPWEDEI